VVSGHPILRPKTIAAPINKTSQSD